MAEMVSSAVVQETVSRIVSSVLGKCEEASSAEHQLERLEMAHIKLEAALEASKKWHITDAPLLRWQKKLECAAQECDDMLHKCRQQLQEQEVRNSSSLTKRIAHSTKSFISSMFYGNSGELSRSAVRRFEWFADGASEFLRFVEFGGTPHHYSSFQPHARHLLAGNTIKYKSVWGNKCHLFRIQPFNIVENSAEAKLTFVYRDSGMPEDNFTLALVLQLSESTDIIGVSIKCLQLFTHHFNSIAEMVKKELTRLPTQDFLLAPYAYSRHAEHLENLHSIYTQWFRPNPLCCKQQSLHRSYGNIGKIGLSDSPLEHIVLVHLEGHVSLCGGDEKRIGTNRKRNYLQGSPLMKLGLFFMPHSSLENRALPAVDSSIVEVINGEEQLHANITLEQLGKVMLPNPIDRLHQNAKGEVYQMLWKSKHGNAYLRATKENSQIMTKRRTIQTTNGMMLQQLCQYLRSLRDEVFAFLNLWAAHAHVQMQGSMRDWFDKELEDRF